MTKFTQQHSSNVTSLNGEFSEAGNLYDQIASSASKIDTTLTAHIDALKTRTLKGLAELEKKMLRAEKRKFVTEQEQIQKIKATLFPGNSLQERVENFSALYGTHHKAFFQTILAFSQTFGQQFTVLVNK